ncbi:BURP domain-containing protein 3-like [Mercurialis annua]|uniref:BURP domain-containing protein 3-like n=1 Tax=Mercurialis annua TaxID=3986 RepID=UPI00215F9A9A|nr:BURP domain-containing protein 3-like [Mercurialis annua]
MVIKVAYCILFFYVLLLTSGHAGAIRVATNQEHFCKNIKEVINEKSIDLYYKILTELFKRPTGPPGPGLPGKGVQFDNFVLDFIEPSYIGLFTPNNVYSGKVLPIYFPIKDNASLLPFTIPRQMVHSSVTRSLSELGKIFKPLLNLHRDSKNHPDNFDACEIQPDESDSKICVRDIESIVEFINRVFKSDESKGSFKIFETKQPETYSTASLKEYVVIGDPEEIEGEKKVICHPMSDAFYCHFAFMTKVLKVSLATENGDKVETMAICHVNPNTDSILNRMLGLKPGSDDLICHFLPSGHFIWVQSHPIALIGGARSD